VRIVNEPLGEILLLLGTALAAVLLLRRLHVPSILAYLLVGVLVGPHTPGPIVDAAALRPLAEFGIVFLLFTIGLSFSIPQLHALRHLVLGLGTAQVALTTAGVALITWLAGLPGTAAFVVGAVFAQSSTTVIGRQLAEQGEEQTRHGRLSLALSVFHDVTAVPFVVVIPVLARAIAPRAELVLLHAFNVPFEGKLRFAGVEEESINRYRVEAKQAALQQLTWLAADAGLDPGATRFSVLQGDASRHVVEQEQEQDCDLIVLGKHGRNAIEELLLGSVTKHVLAESSGDVAVSSQSANSNLERLLSDASAPAAVGTPCAAREARAHRGARRARPRASRSPPPPRRHRGA